MELLTKEIQERLPKLYETEEIEAGEKVAQVKFFCITNGWTWYGVEYDPNEKLFFGLVEGWETEWGYFSLEEFEEINKSNLFPIIERDLYFKPTKIKDLKIDGLYL
jgi:Protein of unknown function (DUF2958)